MADDRIKPMVVNALVKDGWTITHDPYPVRYGRSKLLVDLGAERSAVAAERGGERIAVEIKSFLAPSLLHEFQEAVGQFLLYRFALRAADPDRVLFLAVTDQVYAALIARELTAEFLRHERIPTLVVRPDTEEVVEWVR